jgi:hypothetical protein
MKRRHLLFGAAAVLALALTVPALGGPSNPIAREALSLTKVNKKAKNALSTANAAQATASNALGVANGKEDKVRWALVSAADTILAQSGGISITGTGVPYIDFGSSQVNHALLVTPLYSNAVGANSQATVALCGGPGNPGGINCGAGNDVNHVTVVTTDSSGSGAARGFWIASVP